MPWQVNLQTEELRATCSQRTISHLASIGVLTAAGLILFLFESAIPKPLPWLKPGLSNLVTLLALYLYDLRTAFVIVLLRVLMGAFILGTLFNPVFLFALSGGLVATGAMGLLFYCPRRVFSILGISIMGAFAHNLVQIVLAAFLVVGRAQVLYLMPIMLLSSLFSGFLVGIFAHFVVQRLQFARVL
jgi:heptaprenyl diphosphate synthase